MASFIAWFIPRFDEKGSATAYCPLVPHQCLLWYFAIYTVGWWYGKGIVRWLKTNMPSLDRNLDPLLALGAFICGVVFIYYLEQYEWMIAPPEPPRSWLMLYLFDMFIASALILTLALAINTRLLHYSGIVFMGRYSLGSYVVHCYMFGKSGILTLFGVPEVVTSVEHSRNFPGASLGLGQITVMLAYSILLMLTFGPVFQMGCLALYNGLLQGVNELVDSALQHGHAASPGAMQSHFGTMKPVPLPPPTLGFDGGAGNQPLQTHMWTPSGMLTPRSGRLTPGGGSRIP
jgi:hypothetical protein